MSLFFALLIIAIGIGGILVLAWLVNPQRVRVDFPNPPGFARINTPHPKWTKAQRTRHLPNGDTYVIPPNIRGHFVVLADWPVECNFREKRVALTVPRGAITDFASIPNFLHSLLSPLNNTIYAAVLHDYLYRDPHAPEASAVSRADADRAFYWGMRACGVRRHTAGLMYIGVKAGGRGSYKRQSPLAA